VPDDAPSPEIPADARAFPDERAAGRHRTRDRVSAAIEVVVVCGFPTQIGLVYVLALLGQFPVDGQLSMGYVTLLLGLDASLVIALVVWFLRRRGDSLRETFLGGRPIGREALIGLPLTLVVFGIVIVVLSLVQILAPWLHNVPVNPIAGLIRTGRDAAIFGLVATFAGGVREEIQRAFVLRRFERYLGGARVGLVVFSVAFGAGHALQGWDAAITTGLLGAFWGVVYLARGSIVAPMVSHSAFNAAEIVRFAVWGS